VSPAPFYGADVFHWVYKKPSGIKGERLADPSTELNLAEIEAKLSHSKYFAELPHTKVSHCSRIFYEKWANLHFLDMVGLNAPNRGQCP